MHLTISVIAVTNHQSSHVCNTMRLKLQVYHCSSRRKKQLFSAANSRLWEMSSHPRTWLRPYATSIVSYCRSRRFVRPPWDRVLLVLLTVALLSEGCCTTNEVLTFQWNLRIRVARVRFPPCRYHICFLLHYTGPYSGTLYQT